jgi:hypothetical protein
MDNLLARCSHLFPSLREAWYAIPVRLMVGYGFVEHGYAKLTGGPADAMNKYMVWCREVSQRFVFGCGGSRLRVERHPQ